MKQILYILKHNAPFFVEALVPRAHDIRVEMILIQDATRANLDGGSVFALAEDAPADTRYSLISYEAMLEKIFKADQVILV